MDRYVLPIADPVDTAPTSLDVRHQVPSYTTPEPLRPPEGAPNILLVLLDDVGFGAPSAFGGPCQTPTAERLAANGLRYSRFHTTALCSPTRTALLTGRNHHSCGMGSVTELATAAPGYTGMRPRSTATIARVLSCNGYATGAFGKMHQTPAWEQSPAGPFDRWPTNEGFDRFYGFLGAETNQFTPNLIDGMTAIEAPATEEEGYHLSEDLVEQADRWIESVSTLDPEKPWFCYLSFGACHSPYHLPRDWRDRYRGGFAHGWDEQRGRTMARQQQLGLVPDGAELAPWTPEVPHWEELDEAERVVAERLMECYAAFLEHTDSQVGRLIDELDRRGQLDNTLIFYVLGDNGASGEGGFTGTLNEMVTVNGLREDASRMVKQIDEIGGPMTYPLYPVGWAVAMNTPYQWTKQVASHYGGTRNGLVVHWPSGIAARGEVRHQWHHCIDIVPTILEAACLPAPTTVDGIHQRPIEGTSMCYSFDAPNAPDRRTTQYFEMFGNRGIYHHGWTAVAKHRAPWSMGEVLTLPFGDDVWELYDTRTDWTQARDLAGEHPAKLDELKQLFLVEAAKYQVLPLDDRIAERFVARFAGRRDLMAGRTSLTLTPNAGRLREDAMLTLKNTSFRLTAVLDAQDDATDGVLIAQGGRFGGWSLYVKDGRPTYCYNVAGLERFYIRADGAIEAGRHEIEFVFDYDGGLGKGGVGRLLIDGREVGEGRVGRTVPFVFSVDETVDVGVDRGTPVNEEYSPTNNAYRGKLETVRIDVGPDAVAPPVVDSVRAALATH
jgi:arylsulfatase